MSAVGFSTLDVRVLRLWEVDAHARALTGLIWVVAGELEGVVRIDGRDLAEVP